MRPKGDCVSRPPISIFQLQYCAVFVVLKVRHNIKIDVYRLRSIKQSDSVARVAKTACCKLL